MASTHAMETVTSADETPIAFERMGSGPPLVLVHGGACDHRFWDLSDIRSTLEELENDDGSRFGTSAKIALDITYVAYYGKRDEMVWLQAHLKTKAMTGVISSRLP